MPVLRRLCRYVALIGVQLLVVLVLLEAAGRLFDPLGISYYPETARYFDTLVLEEPIGYRNRPGLQGEFYGVPISINALGMRDRAVPDKAEGEFRVLVIGDSVPFGIGVRYEDSFPHQLEVLLNQKYPGRRFRTLNLGVPSYNTEQELIQLKSLGLALKPDAVMLQFAPNDIEPKRWVLDKRRRWYVNLAQRSYAACLLYVLLQEVRRHLAVMAVPSATADNPVLGGSKIALGEYRLDSPRWQAIDRSLTEINALLHARHVPFVVFADDVSPLIIDLLQGVARRDGFPLVNLRRGLDPRWAGQDEALFHNSRVDSHPSPLGNRALATLMAENLDRLKALERR